MLRGIIKIIVSNDQANEVVCAQELVHMLQYLWLNGRQMEVSQTDEHLTLTYI